MSENDEIGKIQPIRLFAREILIASEVLILLKLESLLKKINLFSSFKKNKKIQFGFTVKNSHVISLELRNQNLSSVPEFIENLQFLEILDLSENNIVTLAPSLKNLQYLKELNILGNDIDDINKNIKELGYLKKIWIYDSRIEKYSQSSSIYGKKIESKLSDIL